MAIEVPTELIEAARNNGPTRIETLREVTEQRHYRARICGIAWRSPRSVTATVPIRI